jgi:hypothetical protein
MNIGLPRRIIVVEPVVSPVPERPPPEEPGGGGCGPPPQRRLPRPQMSLPTVSRNLVVRAR